MNPLESSLISGGSDATLKLWDLEEHPNPGYSPGHIYRPIANIGRAGNTGSTGSSRNGHRFGITHVSFYPFDRSAFLSSSYDHTLKLWSTESAQLSGSFDLGSKVYTHASSPVASHLLIACATQHPAIRLVDLRTSSAVQALMPPGQAGSSAGANLSVSWSPTHQHILASGTVDGAIRVWDVRRASGLIALFDQEDSLGIYRRMPPVSRVSFQTNEMRALHERGIRASAKAHNGPVNALSWTDDSQYLISSGHDRRIRVWDAATGANCLTSFGPTIRNNQLASLPMFTSPVGLAAPGKEVLFFPNESEILVLDLHEGSVVTRLRSAVPSQSAARTSHSAVRSAPNRVTSIVWRGAGGGGSSSGIVMGGTNSPGGIYSGHTDGKIRAWIPMLEGLDDEGDDFNGGESAEDEKKAKRRKVLDDAFRGLMGKQVTFA